MGLGRQIHCVLVSHFVYQKVGMWLPRKMMGIGFRPLHALYIFMLCAT